MVEAYIAPIYEPVAPILSFNKVPRFGHTSNITDIFTDDGSVDGDVIIDYVMGSIFIAAFLLVTYIIFINAVVILKCCFGPDAGILAGHPFLEDKSLKFDKPKKNAYFRSFIIYMNFCIVVAGCIFLAKGTQQVSRVGDDVRSGAEGLKTVAGNVVATADSLIGLSETSMPIRDKLRDITIGEGICKTDFDSIAFTLADILDQIQDFAEGEVTDIKEVFATEMMDLGNGLGNQTDTIQRLSNPAYYAGPAISLGFVLMVGTLLAWFAPDLQIYFKIQTWFFLPLFFLLLLVTIAGIAIVGAALVTNSDFCIGNELGTPEATAGAIISKFDFDEAASSALNYYIISGCRSEFSQLAAVDELLLQLNEGLAVATDLQVTLSTQKEFYEQYCGGGPGSLDEFVATLTLAVTSIDDVKDVAESATDLLTCKDINDIWIYIAHDAICTSAPLAFAWMFSSMVGIYIAGMIVFMLRGAMIPSEDINDKGVYNNDDTFEDFSDDHIMINN
mmetsp:Transcript_30085/g.34977  ORF Transcript_30085/g.34977 Transcript_30085/m.34977 type:complete len:503 (+) Transcript_30085:54-1562(+)